MCNSVCHCGRHCTDSTHKRGLGRSRSIMPSANSFLLIRRRQTTAETVTPLFIGRANICFSYRLLISVVAVRLSCIMRPCDQLASTATTQCAGRLPSNWESVTTSLCGISTSWRHYTVSSSSGGSGGGLLTSIATRMSRVWNGRVFVTDSLSRSLHTSSVASLFLRSRAVRLSAAN